MSAQQRAREVIAEHGVTTWPLVPEQIAEAEGLPVIVNTGFPRDTFGALYTDGRSFSILMSEDFYSEGQRRFTLCHELGHYFLEGHVDAMYGGGANISPSTSSHFRRARDWMEIEADAFAAELLVPMQRARALMSDRQPGLERVRDIERAFDTSMVCAAVRYANLSADPVVSVLSCNREVEWASFSERMREHTWARRPARGEWAPPRSATFALSRTPPRVLAGETSAETGLLSEWFEGAPDVPVREEAIGLGPYGRVLTVLTCEALPSVDALQYREEKTARRDRDWRAPLRTYSWDEFDEVED